MTKDYKRYGKTGQFKKPNIADGTAAIRRQSETKSQYLRKNQIRTDEYGRDYVRGFEKTGSNLLTNFSTNKQLADKIYSTQEWATALRQKREVEYLKSLSDEYGKKAAFWEDFSTTQFKKYWGAATYLYEEWDRRRTEKESDKDYREEGEQNYNITTPKSGIVTEWTTDQEVDDPATIIASIADDEFLKEEARLTREGIRTNSSKINDYKATNYIVTAGRKLTLSRQLDRANKIVANKNIENRFWAYLEEQSQLQDNPLILNSRTVAGLFLDNGLRILDEAGIGRMSKAGVKIINHWKDLGLQYKYKLNGQEEVRLGKNNIAIAFEQFKNEDDPTRRAVLLENLVTTKKNAWEHDEKTDSFITNTDKNNRHTDGWIPTFELLIDNDYYTGEGGRGRLIEDVYGHMVWDQDGPTGESIATKFEKQQTVLNLLKYLDANEQLKLDAITNDRAATATQETLDMYQYLNNLPNGLNSQADEDEFYAKFIEGRSESDKVKLEARKVLNYRTDHANKWRTHSAIKKAYYQGDTQEFILHYYTLTENEKQIYGGMFKIVKQMQQDFGGPDDVFNNIEEWADNHVLNVLREPGFEGLSSAKANVHQDSLEGGAEHLRQLQIKAYQELEGKATGAARISQSKINAVEEFSKIEIIEADSNPFKKRILSPWHSLPTDDSVLDTESIIDALTSDSPLSNPREYTSSAIRAAQKNPEITTDTNDANQVNILLSNETLMSKTHINAILLGAAQGKDVLTMPKNIQLIWELSDKSRTQTELLNYALKAQGYTTKDNLIPLDQTDILQKEWPKKIAGISPRHYNKLVPYFLIDGTKQLIERTK